MENYINGSLISNIHKDTNSGVYVSLDEQIINFKKNDLSNYIELLFKDIKKIDKVHTCIYISKNLLLLDEEQITFFLKNIPIKYKFIYIESDLKSLTKDKILILKNNKVVRVTIIDDNLSNKSLLDKKITLLNNQRISVDLTINIPINKVDVNLYKEIIDVANYLEVEHFSIYDEEETASKYFYKIKKYLEILGYTNYDTTHFCKKGKISIMNFVYLNFYNWYPVGNGAKGFISNNREEIFDISVEYKNKIFVYSYNNLSIEDIFDLLIYNFSTNILGINLNLSLHNIFYKRYENIINKLVKNNYCERENEIIRMTSIKHSDEVYNLFNS